MTVPIDPRLLNLFSLLLGAYQGRDDDSSVGGPPTLPGATVDPSAASRVDQRVDQMLLVVQAMWTLVQEKTGLTDAELLARVTELDERDGTKDGRFRRPPVKCARCGATVARRFNRCLYCGQQYTGGTAFEAI